MKTAAEFLDQGNFNNTTDMMIEFAQMHVKAALEAASENAIGVHCTDYVDPDSILDVYPESNIK